MQLLLWSNFSQNMEQFYDEIVLKSVQIFTFSKI